MTWQSVCSHKASCVWGCIQSTEGSSLNSVLKISHLKYFINIWGPQHRKDLDLLKSPEETTEMTRGMEHLSHGNELKKLVLLSLEKTPG